MTALFVVGIEVAAFDTGVAMHHGEGHFYAR